MYKWNPHVTRETFPKDFLASLVVFLMALPLCMGIALASGVPAELGLITGIIGGCVVGFITGSPLQVSGPAAGLTVLVYEIVSKHGVEALAVIVLTAGLLQIVMGILSIGQVFRSVSPAVVNGMMSGIGITLILSQMYIIAGLHPKAEGLENIQHFPQLVSHLFEPASIGPISVGIGALTILILYTWSKFARGKFAAIPAPLIAVTICTAITAVFNLPITHVSLPDNIFGAVKIANIQAVGHM
ncbi:MAG: SulP family inorganic anion transporter, partial [Leptolyngbya sp.]|nr:SulP family inorganic anion transporter [Candidatus Melainabacteria bacterium]